MPEFEQRKRKSMTQEQLYEEYHNTGKGKTRSKSSSKPANHSNGGKPKSKPKSKPVKREALPVSPERKIRQAQSDKRYAVEKKAIKTARKNADLAAKGKSNKNKKASKKKKGNYLLYYVLLGIVVTVVLYVLSVTVLFNITTFEIRGEVNYSDEEIIEACGITKGENLLRVNIGRAEEAIITKLVYIDSAEIHRGFPNRLTIKVEPAKPVACFAYGSSTYYLVSAGGRLLEISSTPSKDCPLVKGYRPNLSDKAEVGLPLTEDSEKRISLAKTVIECMEKNGLTESYTLDVSDTLGITIKYDDRIVMEIGSSAALDQKIQNGSELIKKRIAENDRVTINLLNPDRVPVRPIHDENNSNEGYVVTTSAETTAEETTPSETTKPE